MVKNRSLAMWFFFPLPPKALQIGIQGWGTAAAMSIIWATRLCVGKTKVGVRSVWAELEREGAYVLIEFLAEGLALSRALAQDLQSSFGRPEGPHAVMDPARPQPALSYLKPPALTWLERKTGTADSVIPSWKDPRLQAEVAPQHQS